jgi:hypothetical protein
MGEQWPEFRPREEQVASNGSLPPFILRVVPAGLVGALAAGAFVHAREAISAEKHDVAVLPRQLLG